MATGQPPVVLWIFLGTDGIGTDLSQIPSVGPGLQRDLAFILVQQQANRIHGRYMISHLCTSGTSLRPTVGFPGNFVVHCAAELQRSRLIVTQTL